MALNPKAYTVPIKPLNSGLLEDDLIHQVSPSWVLTFVRWEVRDTLRTKTSNPLAIRNHIVVENDCISVEVTCNKGSLTPAMSATLVQTDINYETAIAPGDFVFINMLNWETDSRRVAENARVGKPINEIVDGFKGIFKVQGVRKTIQTDPETGTRRLVFKIDGFAFTEFNNTIYFNPNLINQKSLQNSALYISDIASAWASYVSLGGKPAVQEIIAFLIQNLIGAGVNPKAKYANGLLISPNVHFLVPFLVGKLLGVVTDDKPGSQNHSHVVSAKDIYSYLFGIQKYAGSSASAKTLADGLNPSNLRPRQEYPGFYYTKEFCQGNSILKAEYWNQVKVWSILNQYTNSPLNELYTCFKVNKANRVMPTVVFRQIPFTSEDFVKQSLGTQDKVAASISVTRFLTLPRWHVDPGMVLNFDIGRDESARINFLQYYAKSNFSDKGVEISGETAAGNFVFDQDDIKRSGLRPYVVQVQFDDLPGSLAFAAPRWARIVGDAVIGGQLRMNGTLSCAGIIDPITVGDNLEFDNTVYHIEQVTHSCVQEGGGKKTFRTTISMSHGVSVNSTATGTLYSEMANTNAYTSRDVDFKNNQILPGVSESQDVPSRSKNLDLSTATDPKNALSGFDQPSTTFNKPKRGE